MQQLVVIESPYYPDPNEVRRFADFYSTRDLFAQNLAYARICMINSIEREESPFSVNLLFNGLDTTLELRTQALVAGHEWARRADALFLYCDLGVSESMTSAAEHAKLIRTQVHRRNLWNSAVDVYEARRRLHTMPALYCPQLEALDERPSARLHVIPARRSEGGE